MKKVVIISSSIRTGSNSEILAKECQRGALESGNEVEFLSLKGKRIEFCRGCLSCQKTGICIIKDDVADIIESVRNADVIVFATPIYYFELCGQLKTLLDRLNPLYESNYHFRDIYLIATAAEEEKDTFDRAYQGLQGWVDCFPEASLKGIVKGYGISDPRSAEDHREVMKEAYELGRKL